MTTAISHDHQEIDERFRIIADTAPVMIWISGTDKGYQFCNKGWLDFTGRSMEQEIANGWTANIHPDDLDHCLESYTSDFDSRRPFSIEFRLKRYDGQYRWLLSNGVPRYNKTDEFAGYMGSCIDIHEQKAAREFLEQAVADRTAEITQQAEELRRQKEFSDTIFNASVDVLIVYDKQMNFMALNKAALETYKLDETAIGKNLFDIFPKIRNSQGHQDTLRALKGEFVHNTVYKSTVADVYYENFLVPLKDKNNEVYAALVVAHNISDRIETEVSLKKINDQLQSQNSELLNNNEDLESFNYIASHDLQEPLRKVSMFASRIFERDGANLSPQSMDYFGRINSAINRMQKLIQALLNYSGANSDDVQFVRTNLDKVLKEVRNNLDEVISEKHAIIESVSLPTISAVPLQIQQVLLNLVSNALKYSKPEVPPIIKIGATEEIVEERDNKKYLKISVTDNGIGFDPQYKTKIFELFQRLHGKTEFEGTGIGLAICQRIIYNHHGFMTADSLPGEGSVFNIFLPLKK
jgi:PAS domain S-box-containing protein